MEMASSRIKGEAFYTWDVAGTRAPSHGEGTRNGAAALPDLPATPASDLMEGVPTSCRIVDGVVESVYAGMVTPEELDRAVRLTLDLAKGSGFFRFCSDVADLVGGHSVGDLFAMIASLEQAGLPRTLREAIVTSGSLLPSRDVQFYEDACRNRGWNVRIFPDRASALAWLKSD
jgi:hypothetical protein